MSPRTSLIIIFLVFLITIVQSRRLQRDPQQKKKSLLNEPESLRRSLNSAEYQPDITIVEGRPVNKGFSSISNDKGTPWCGGNPTYWITGHQRYETPSCFVNGVWTLSETTQLDGHDEMNGVKWIDRHACVTMDVNKDGLEDIICSVGAVRGKGEGYNELYITQENGSITKIPKDHGLQEYPTMSTRYVVTLRNELKEKEFVLFATIRGPREDGLSNVHRMFRNIYTEEGIFPYFEEVKGPWTKNVVEAYCAVAGDFTNDDLDDLILCDRDGPPLLVRQVQKPNKTKFRKIDLPTNQYLKNWRNVRIANVTDNAFNDLVVVTEGQPSKLYVFEGKDGEPYFDFHNPYFEAELEWSSPNLEVLDVNKDGIPDIYVVQVNENKTEYCGVGNKARDWWGDTTVPPLNYTPPLDMAHDMLFVGKRSRDKPYNPVKMVHELPGCGFLAQRWDDETMLLGQGNWDSAGYSLLLKW